VNTLADTKAWLRVTGTSEDTLITALLGGIDATIKANLSNYIVAVEDSVYLDGGGEHLRLPRVPVSEEDGDEIVVHDDIYNVDVDEDMYRLVPTTGQIFYKNEATLWPTGAKRYFVTYKSGFSLRDDYDDVVERIKLAELVWIADIFFNRSASVSKETIDEVSWVFDMTADLPKNVRTILQGLLDVLSDF